jgi:uncharacterized membrane protein
MPKHIDELSSGLLPGALIINVWMTLAHYVHERLWLKLKWGTNTDDNTSN